jgi:hypothetical protein
MAKLLVVGASPWHRHGARAVMRRLAEKRTRISLQQHYLRHPFPIGPACLPGGINAPEAAVEPSHVAPYRNKRQPDWCSTKACKAGALNIVPFSRRMGMPDLAAQATLEECSVRAEHRDPSRRLKCQPTSALLFVKAVTAFGASLEER